MAETTPGMKKIEKIVNWKMIKIRQRSNENNRIYKEKRTSRSRNNEEKLSEPKWMESRLNRQVKIKYVKKKIRMLTRTAASK